MGPKPSSSGRFVFPTLTLHCALIALVFSLAIFRFFIADASDRHHCRALLNDGRWLDSAHHQWQSDGCMLVPYKPAQVTQCLQGRHVVFFGDSTVRQVFYGAARHLDPTIDTVAEKHSDRTIIKNNVQLSFYWDPFLNSSRIDDFLSGKLAKAAGGSVPTLAVIGSGIWYLRHGASSGGIAAWQTAMSKLFTAVAPGSPLVADEVVLLPVENAVMSKLAPDRAATVRPDDIKLMNDYLASQLSRDATLAIPKVFNTIIDGLEEETVDGLHFSDAVSKVQANVLLNLRCNDVLPKKFPFDKTCCSQYPTPNWVQFLILVVLLGWGPLGLYLNTRPEANAGVLSYFPDPKYFMPLTIFGFAVSFLFVADRSSLFLKENKQYDALTFAFLMLAALGAGLATLKPAADRDLGFLNREQTDEWKGWMQVAILIYHYLGASKISGIYNPIRICVAAYLFQTGYGHLTFFLKKGDFGFARVANILVRLNLLTVVLSYIMKTDYLSYYFSPLVTLWFLIIWVTMWAGHKYNERTLFLLGKIVVFSALTAAYFQIPGPLEKTFDVLNAVFATEWNAREWRFRIALDMWIVWGGMLTALLFIKIKDLRITERPEWAQWERATVIASGVTMAGYMAFELTRESKFVYNAYHPYISILPVLAFCVLRNATPWLRSTSSNFFAFFGRCSLETFIIQFHLFIAADTKGIIMMLPGGAIMRPFNFIITSLVFVFVSNQVASATGALTDCICNKGVARLPVARAAPSSSSPSSTAAYTPLEPIAEGSSAEKVDMPPSATPLSAATTQKAPSGLVGRMLEMVRLDLRFKMLGIMVGLWLLNEIYPGS